MSPNEAKSLTVEACVNRCPGAGQWNCSCWGGYKIHVDELSRLGIPPLKSGQTEIGTCEDDVEVDNRDAKERARKNEPGCGRERVLCRLRGNLIVTAERTQRTHEFLQHVEF